MSSLDIPEVFYASSGGDGAGTGLSCVCSVHDTELRLVGIVQSFRKSPSDTPQEQRPVQEVYIYADY